MKTNELIGDALDRAVGIAMRLPASYWSEGKCAAFSTDWSHGGPIIERECITLDLGARMLDAPKEWCANCGHGYYCGPTPLIAAMRCYVASVLGMEVPDGL